MNRLRVKYFFSTGLYENLIQYFYVIAAFEKKNRRISTVWRVKKVKKNHPTHWDFNQSIGEKSSKFLHNFQGFHTHSIAIQLSVIDKTSEHTGNKTQYLFRKCFAYLSLHLSSDTRTHFRSPHETLLLFTLRNDSKKIFFYTRFQHTDDTLKSTLFITICFSQYSHSENRQKKLTFFISLSVAFRLTPRTSYSLLSDIFDFNVKKGKITSLAEFFFWCVRNE